MQALKAIEALIQEDDSALEEARKARLAPALTKVLAKTTDEAVLDATSSLISVLTGATVHSERVLTVTYPEVGPVAVHECSLGEGVGARLWGISHAFNRRLIENRGLIQGASVLELGSGVGSTGALHVSRRGLHLQLGNRTHRVPDTACMWVISPGPDPCAPCIGLSAGFLQTDALCCGTAHHVQWICTSPPCHFLHEALWTDQT